MFRILLSTLELEASIIPGQQPRKPNKHFPQRRMDVKVELAFQVVRTELSEMGFIPDDDVCLADAMEAGPTREKGVEDGGYVFEVLRDELTLVAGHVRICGGV